MAGGEPGTRTLNSFLNNGFQDHLTTNYHNSPYYLEYILISLKDLPSLIIKQRISYRRSN